MTATTSDRDRDGDHPAHAALCRALTRRASHVLAATNHPRAHPSPRRCHERPYVHVVARCATLQTNFISPSALPHLLTVERGWRLCHAMALVILLTLLPRAALSQPTAATLSLPVGREHTGWQVARGCATFDDDSVIVPAGASVVYRDYRFRSFVLECDYLARGGGAEPVIYFHSDVSAVTGQPVGRSLRVASPASPRPWRRRQAARSRVATDGEWKHLRLEVIGDQAVVATARHGPATPPRDGHGEGFLALASAGSAGTSAAFKNVQVTELDYHSLLNGRDLTGWQGATDDASLCWKMEDGLLVCTGEQGPWLRSTAEYGDFNLRLQYRLKEGGNSGVYVRVPADGNHHGPGAGIEVQILDDRSERYRELKPYQFSASLYAVAPAAPGSGRPPGEWNSLEINCRGHRYTISHNGIIVLDTSEREYPQLLERLVRGYLGLQNHSETVWFRNIRIGPPR